MAGETEPRGLTDAQLSSIVATQIEQAKTHERSERSTQRDKALDYFFGRMDQYVPPEANRSKVVSRDVADTISRMLPGVIRVFAASGRMAVAEATETNDVDFAREATDGINYVFWKENNGYGVLYSAIWDALLVGNGIVKTWYDPTPVYRTSFHSGLTEDQVALLLQADEKGNEPEVLASTQSEATIPDPMSGQPVQVPVFDLKIKRMRYPGTFVVDAIPPEEFLIHADAVETESAAFTDHWQQKTRSDLVKMGYDAAKVGAIPEASRVSTPEGAARDPSAGVSSEAADKSMQLVDYHECFIWIDVDGDGEAELVRACYGGSQNGTLLDWEVWEDENPFDDIKCEPIPHRWLARSISDSEIDVQDIKTVLSRQMMNGTYWQNNPLRFAKGTIKNPEMLDNPVFGGTVFGDANASVENLEVAFTPETSLAGIAYMDKVSQRRTGISEQTMALDPDALQNQTATAAQIGHDASYSQTELIARNMAEWGWSKVFRKILRLMVKHQDYAREVVFNGKPVKFDPRAWNADMNVTINVGLGTGARDRDIMMLQAILQNQLLLADRFMASGAVNDAIDMLPKILETMKRMAEVAGIKNPEDYYPDYTADKVAQLKQLAAQKAQQPNPEVVKAQADIAAKDAQAGRDHEYRMAQANSDITLNQQKAAAENEQQLTRINGELNNKRYQIDQELALKAQQINAELALKQSVPAIQPGGQPG